MSEPLPIDEIKFRRNFCPQDLLNTPNDIDIGHFLEVNLSYPYNIRQKTKHFPFAPENKIIDPDDFPS